MMKITRHNILLFIICFCGINASYAHVPHDIIYSLDLSPNYANDGLVLSSSTQFGEMHLMSDNYGELFVESNAGMERSLVIGHVYSPNFKNDGEVYTLTKKGYYKSTNRGVEWVKQAAFEDEEVLSICLANDYLNSKDMYVLTKTGVFLVQNDGADVSRLKELEETSFGKVMITDNTLFVHQVYYQKEKEVKGMEHINYSRGVVDTYDLKTKKWDTLNSQFSTSIIVDYDISKTDEKVNILLSLKDGQVLLSQDTGKTWNAIYTKSGDFINQLKFSPDYANDETIAIGTAKGFVYMSKNKGNDWQLKSNGLVRWVAHTNIQLKHLKFSPNYKNDKTIFLGKTTGVYKTTDKGEYWRYVNVWNTRWVYYVLPAPGKESKYLFTATYNSGISRSHDNGASWHSANIGITSAFANGMALSPNYHNDKTIFALDIATGLYRSSNAGKSWAEVEDFDMKKLYDKQVLHRELGISNEFDKDGIILMFTVPLNTLGINEKMVWKYNDITKEVKKVEIGTNKNYIHCFSFTPKGIDNSVMFCGSGQGAFASYDKGDTWINIFKGESIQQIVVSPDFQNDGLIYLMDHDGEIHLSYNSGKSFQKTDLNLKGQYVNNLTFSPTYASDHTIYVTTYGEGVLKSINNGETWDYLGLKGKFLYTGISFSSNYEEDKTIFAPTVGGVYRSTNNGYTWKNTFDKTQLLSKSPLFTLLDPEGKMIDLNWNTVKSMKEYEVYDQEVGAEIFASHENVSIKKLKSEKAYLGAYYKFNATAGHAVEVYFYGSSIEYKCVKGNDMGIVEIFIDDESQGRVDLYSSNNQFDVTGFFKSGLNEGFHTLRIEATGTKNVNSEGKSFSYNAATVGNVHSPISDTAISNETDLKLNVYPNPTTEFVNVVSEYEDATLSVFDTNGQEIYRTDEHLNVTTINLKAHPAGAYIIRLTAGKNVGSRMVIKQ